MKLRSLLCEALSRPSVSERAACFVPCALSPPDGTVKLLWLPYRMYRCLCEAHEPANPQSQLARNSGPDGGMSCRWWLQLSSVAEGRD